MYGDKPYDKNIMPVESLPVAIAAMGEGFHNYHVRIFRFYQESSWQKNYFQHVFPWDYKTGEFGKKTKINLSKLSKINSTDTKFLGGWKGYQTNITTAFIDLFAKLGWAYNRKSATAEMIEKRVAKSGDGSHFLSHEEAHKTSIWGFGDKDIDEDEISVLERMKN